MVYLITFDHCLQVNGPGKTEIYHTKAMFLNVSMSQMWLWSLGPVWSEEAAVKAAEAKAGIEDSFDVTKNAGT